MKPIINVIIIALLGFLIIPGCTKVADLPYYQKGVDPDLGVSPSVVITPTSADNNKTVLTLNWSDPKYATDSNHVKFVIEIDSAGRNFSKAFSRTVTKTLTTSFTGRDLNTILVNYGYALGKAVKLDVRVVSSYSNNNDRHVSNVVQITATPYSDPPTLSSEKSSVTCSIATATQHSNTFTWTPAFPGYSGTVTYSIEYDSVTKGFVKPGSILVGNDLYTKDLSQSDMNTTAIGSGITGGTSGKVEYRIKAVTAGGAIAYSNVLNGITISTYVVALYMVGGSTPIGWTPSAAIPMIPDPRFPGTFFGYVKLTAGGGGLKFLSEATDWNSPTIVIYGDVNASGNTGNLTSTGGGQNVSVPSDGVYRVTVDLAASKYYLQTGGIGAVGLVGAIQSPTTWDPPTAIKMYNQGPNKFIFITNMSQNDEFKFHDGNDWTNSSNTNSRWYDMDGSNKIIINGTGAGNNFKWTGTTGKVRAIFDYSDVSNPKWSLSEANGMWIVGSATPGNWSNNGSETDIQSIPLTYMGNGVWKATNVTLSTGDMKFIVKKGNWDFSYGGSGGSLVWDNGANIHVDAGTYTITVDEYNGTYTIL